MDEKRTNRYRYLIAFLLNDLSVGAKFKPSELHITILPWFALETEEQPFTAWFYEHFDKMTAFDSTVSSKKLFGPKKDVPVNIIEPKIEFLKLHELALSWFGDVGARWAERDPYVGDDFIAHIAQRQGFVLKEDQILRINSLTLFKALRREDHVRIVAAKAHLK